MKFRTYIEESNLPDSRLLVFLVTILVSIFCRTIYYFDFSENPFFDYIPDNYDMGTYDLGARKFANGDPWINLKREGHAVLYMYFLGIIYKLINDNLSWVWIIQFFFGVLGVYLLTKAYKCYLNNYATFLSGCLYASNSIVIYYEGVMLRESLALFFLILSFYFLSLSLLSQHNHDQIKPFLDEKYIILGFISLSTAVQIRPNFGLLFPLLLIYVFFQLRRDCGILRVFLKCGFYSFIFFGLMIPMVYRGYIIYSEWLFLDSHGPFLLLHGNLPSYPGTGFGPFPEFDSYIEKYSERPPLFKVIFIILKKLFETPLEMVLLYLRKLYFIFNSHEMGQNLSFYAFQRFSSILNNPFSSMAFLATFGVIGVLLTIRSKKFYHLPFIFLVGIFLSIIPFPLLSRYRYPLIPWLIFFSVSGIGYLLNQFFLKRYLIFFSYISVIILLLWVFKTPPMFSRQSCNDTLKLGYAYVNNKNKYDLNKAEKYALQCWNWEVMHSNNHDYGKRILAAIYDQKVNALFDKQNYIDAKRIIDNSIEIFPDYHVPYKLKSNILRKEGNNKQSTALNFQGVYLNFSDPDFHKNLAYLYSNKRDRAFFLERILNNWHSLETDNERARIIKINLEVLEKKNRRFNYGKILNIEKAKSLFNNEKWEEALPEYLKINSFNKDDDILFLEQGVILGNLGKADEALLSLSEGLYINRDNPNIKRIIADYFIFFTKTPFKALPYLQFYLDGKLTGNEETKRKNVYSKLIRNYQYQLRSSIIY